MDLMSTIAGSMMEGYFPAGWDLAKIDQCMSADPTSITDRQPSADRDGTYMLHGHVWQRDGFRYNHGT